MFTVGIRLFSGAGKGGLGPTPDSEACERMPPAQATATLVAVKLARKDHWRREKLVELVARFRSAAVKRGFELLPSSTPIQPLLCGDDSRATTMAQALEAQGYWVAPIRPPTVPEGRSRLRITLSALHTPADVDALVDAMAWARDAVEQGYGTETGYGAIA